MVSSNIVTTTKKSDKTHTLMLIREQDEDAADRTSLL